MDLDARILATLAYADLFGAGLSESGLRQRLFGAGEIHRDDLAERLAVLVTGSALVRDGAGWYRIPGIPPGGQAGVGSDPVAGQIEQVRRWARFAGRLPFVRFIGLTGSLAKGSPGTDADLFVVASPDRAYLAFAFLKSIGAVVARLRGIRICVNYLVDERRMAMSVHDAFTVTEFITMLPLFDAGGLGTRLWETNHEWIRKLCGSATTWPDRHDRRGWGMGLLETLVPGGLEHVIRGWKRRRFVRIKGPAALIWPDVAFEPGFLKQHDASHRREILGRFRVRLRSLGLDDAWVEPVA